MRVDFYHLETVSLDSALPQILQKAYEAGQNILLKVDMAERADYLNSLLWTYQPDSFLPHGVEKDGFAEKQPILITHKDNFNPNNENNQGVELNIPDMPQWI
jgi:DNA polymerase-3 subunit chi